MVHDVLERLLREHSPRALHEMGPKKRAEEIEALLLSYLEEKMGGRAGEAKAILLPVCKAFRGAGRGCRPAVRGIFA